MATNKLLFESFLYALKITQKHQNSPWIQCYSPAPSGTPCLAGGEIPALPLLSVPPLPQSIALQGWVRPWSACPEKGAVSASLHPCQSWERSCRRDCIITRRSFSQREPGQTREAHTIAAFAETLSQVCAVPCSSFGVYSLGCSSRTPTAPLLPPPTEGLMVI